MSVFTNALVQNITIGENVSWANDTMANAFRNCQNFNSPINIPNSINNLYMTFYNCQSFNQPVTIPNSVTSLYQTFTNCRSFNQPVTIPNSVTNVMYAFQNCTNLTQTFRIHNNSGISNAYGMFMNCTNMGGNIYIGKGVTNLQLMFRDVTNNPLNVFIYEDNVVNIYGFAAGRNGASKRMNIYINKQSATYKRFFYQNTASNRALNTSASNISFVSSAGWFFNATYNIYLWPYNYV